MQGISKSFKFLKDVQPSKTISPDGSTLRVSRCSFVSEKLNWIRAMDGLEFTDLTKLSRRSLMVFLQDAIRFCTVVGDGMDVCCFLTRLASGYSIRFSEAVMRSHLVTWTDTWRWENHIKFAKVVFPWPAHIYRSAHHNLSFAVCWWLKGYGGQGWPTLRRVERFNFGMLNLIFFAFTTLCYPPRGN